MSYSPPHVISSPCAGSIPVTFGDFGAGEGLILLSNLGCTGDEENLAECPHSGVASHRCSHREDAGVVCPGIYMKHNSSR